MGLCSKRPSDHFTSFHVYSEFFLFMHCFYGFLKYVLILMQRCDYFPFSFDLQQLQDQNRNPVSQLQAIQTFPFDSRIQIPNIQLQRRVVILLARKHLCSRNSTAISRHCHAFHYHDTVKGRTWRQSDNTVCSNFPTDLPHNHLYPFLYFHLDKRLFTF